MTTLASTYVYQRVNTLDIRPGNTIEYKSGARYLVLRKNTVNEKYGWIGTKIRLPFNGSTNGRPVGATVSISFAADARIVPVPTSATTATTATTQGDPVFSIGTIRVKAGIVGQISASISGVEWPVIVWESEPYTPEAPDDDKIAQKQARTAASAQLEATVSQLFA